MDHTHIRTYFLVVISALLLILTTYLFRPFLVTIGLAAVFAVIFEPLKRRFMRYERIGPALSALATLLVGFICVAVPVGVLGVQLFTEAERVYEVVAQPGSIARAQIALSSLGNSLEGPIPGSRDYFNSLSANVAVYAHQALGWGIGHVAGVFTGTLHIILQLFVFVVTLYYFLKEGPNLRASIARYSPLSKEETNSLVDRMTRTINSVVKGSLVIAILQGVLTAIGFYIFGIPNGLLWGTIAIIGALIPSVGTALVFVPGIIYLLTTGHTGNGIGLAVYGLLGVGVVDNFLRPTLVGGRASIHPLLVLLSVLGGITFFGPAGLFLGPLTISLLLGLLSFYSLEEQHSNHRHVS